MKFYYDLHIHTSLSPCGSLDMTPNNIVNMSNLLGLNIIAITDHNSILNVLACLDVAKKNNLDLIILPGMEVETIEEFHTICLFPDVKSAKVVYAEVEKNLNKVPLKPKIFGDQIILNSDDEEIGTYDNLLITSTKIDIYELVNLCNKNNGIAIPAHIDRNSYSIITNLGFIPDDLNINLVEFSKKANCESFLANLQKINNKSFRYIQSSDAHYLENISERENYFLFDSKPTTFEIINYLKRLKHSNSF